MTALVSGGLFLMSMFFFIAGGGLFWYSQTTSSRKFPLSVFRRMNSLMAGAMTAWGAAWLCLGVLVLLYPINDQGYSTIPMDGPNNGNLLILLSFAFFALGGVAVFATSATKSNYLKQRAPAKRKHIS